MRRQKPKIDRHTTFDPDLFERIEKRAASENKYFNEWINEAALYRLEMTEKQSQTQSQPQTQSASTPEDPTLTLSKAVWIIRDQITPLVYSRNPETIEDKDNFASLLKSLKVLLETVEVKLDMRRRLELPPIPYLNPFEKTRQEGLKKARERREKNERLELMSALPQPIKVMKAIDTDIDVDIDTNIETSSNTTDATNALTTSSTINPHLTEAEFLVLKQQQEVRDKRLKELAEEMRAKAKDSVRFVDESKEIMREEDIPMSPADGDEGVLEDDSDKVPQDEF